MKRSYDLHHVYWQNKADTLTEIEKNGIQADKYFDGDPCKVHYRVTITIEEVQPVYKDGVFVGEELT